MQKVKMIESLISCQTRNHQDQEAFVYVLDDDFNPQQRLLCPNCFKDQSNPLLTINPQQTQRRIQEVQELVYDQVEAIVLSITGSKKSLHSFKKIKYDDYCLDNFLQDYQNDLQRIQRDNREYSFHSEIQNIQLCLFQTENFDQVFEKYYIQKITKEVEKIQTCQQNYISLFDKQMNQERTIDELILTNQFTQIEEYKYKGDLLLSDEVICSREDDKDKLKVKLSDLDTIKQNVKKVETIFNKKLKISFEKNYKKTIIENTIIKQLTNNDIMNFENLLLRKINNLFDIQEDKMNEKIISQLIQKTKQSPPLSKSEIDQISIEKIISQIKCFQVDRIKENFHNEENDIKFSESHQQSKYFTESKIMMIQTAKQKKSSFYQEQFIGINDKYLQNMIIRIILEQLFRQLFLNCKKIVRFSNVFQIFYLEYFQENDEQLSWLKIVKYILIGSEILIKTEFIKIYVNIRRRLIQSLDSNNICDQI